MADAVGLAEAIKRAAMEAVKASKPVEVCFGAVTGTSPLKISVEQKMTLGKEQLILARSVTDYEIAITAPGMVRPGIFQIHNALEVGDEVVLLRQQGGQKYIVVDRLGGGR